MTIDASSDGTSANKKLGTLIGGGSTASSITCKLCHVKDCTFLNVYSYGISVSAINNGTNNDPDESGLVVENCWFSCGTTDSSNEFILTNALKYARINGCSFYGNKAGYVSAQTVTLTNCFINSNGRTEGFGFGIHGRDVDVVNVNMIGQGLTLRPFSAVHWGTNWQSGRRHTVRGYTNTRLTTSYPAIEVSGWDSTFVIDEINLEDLWIGTGPACTLVNAAGQTHSRIGQLTLKNVLINAFDTNNCAVNITDHTINFLTLENLKTPAWDTDNAPIKINATDSTSDISYGKITQIDPLPASNIVTIGISSTFNSTVEMEAPLIGGENGLKSIGSGTGTRTLRFLSNWGRAVFSGDGSTTVFNIAHNLATSPNLNKIQVTAGSAAANGARHVTGTATNIVVTFATAPVSGTNNVVLYWSASAA